MFFFYISIFDSTENRYVIDYIFSNSLAFDEGTKNDEICISVIMDHSILCNVFLLILLVERFKIVYLHCCNLFYIASMFCTFCHFIKSVRF